MHEMACSLHLPCNHPSAADEAWLSLGTRLGLAVVCPAQWVTLLFRRHGSLIDHAGNYLSCSLLHTSCAIWLVCYCVSILVTSVSYPFLHDWTIFTNKVRWCTDSCMLVSQSLSVWESGSMRLISCYICLLKTSHQNARDGSPHLPPDHPRTAADDAWLWLECVLHSGWLCITSRPAFIQGDVVH